MLGLCAGHLRPKGYRQPFSVLKMKLFLQLFHLNTTHFRKQRSQICFYKMIWLHHLRVTQTKIQTNTSSDTLICRVCAGRVKHSTSPIISCGFLLSCLFTAETECWGRRQQHNMEGDHWYMLRYSPSTCFPLKRYWRRNNVRGDT